MVRRPVLYSVLVLLAVAVPAQLVASAHGRGIGHLLAGTPVALAASKVMASLGVAPDPAAHRALAGGSGAIAAPAGDLGYLALAGAERGEPARLPVAAPTADAPAVSGMASAGASGGAGGAAGGGLAARGFPSGGGMLERSGAPGPVGVKLTNGKTQLAAPSSGHTESDPLGLAQQTPIYLAGGTLSTPDSSLVSDAPTSNPALDNGSSAGGNGNGNAYGLDNGVVGGNTDTATPTASLAPQIAAEVAAGAAPLVEPVDTVKQLLAADVASGTTPVVAALAPVLLADAGTVPEPATLALMLLGLMGLGGMARRRD